MSTYEQTVDGISLECAKAIISVQNEVLGLTFKDGKGEKTRDSLAMLIKSSIERALAVKELEIDLIYHAVESDEWEYVGNRKWKEREPAIIPSAPETQEVDKP